MDLQQAAAPMMAEPESVRVHNLAVGQVAEWLVWTRLVATSGGDLHVFLPLDDRGIDGIVHRISTDAYARVQVKGRSVHRYRGIEIQVREDELVDHRAVLVADDVDLAGVQLGPNALVVPVPEFRKWAHRHVNRADITYDAEVTLPPTPMNQWAPFCVPVDGIGDRLLPGSPLQCRGHRAQQPASAWGTERRRSCCGARPTRRGSTCSRPFQTSNRTST